MSDIKIVSPSSGTATFTLTTPSGTSTDRTLTLPDQTSGTVLTTESNTLPKVPVVNLVGDAQTTSSSHFTYKVVTFDESASSHIDTASIFNSSNNRIVPNVAGYYQFYFNCNTHNTDRVISIIQRNGDTTIGGLQQWDDGNSVNYYGNNISGIGYANGTTDYFEFKHLTDGTSKNMLSIHASMCFLRGA